VKTVLFLCTGNYYRSRFAEELFNHAATHAGLCWVAQSRALAIERGVNNIGPLSPFTLDALKRRGMAARGGDRLPRQCALIDLQTADRIVALDEAEHRPLMLERFPHWEKRAEYWQVKDVELVSPAIALSKIEDLVELLVSQLPKGA
jgi:protein-tyrosine phosphatase